MRWAPSAWNFELKFGVRMLMTKCVLIGNEHSDRLTRSSGYALSPTQVPILCLNCLTPSTSALLQDSRIEFKFDVVKVCHWSQMWRESFSTCLLFELNQSYCYYYVLRLAYQKWHSCTLPFLVLPKIHVYHCWSLHSFSLYLNAPLTQCQSHRKCRLIAQWGCREIAHLHSCISKWHREYGSPCFYSEQFQNSLCVVPHYGKPTLFINVTTNTKWPEFKEALNPGSPNDRPDWCTRVFKMKYDALMHDL